MRYIDLDMEEWRPVLGFEGRYEVSSAGQVRSLDQIVARRTRLGNPGTIFKRGRMLRPGIASNGYPTVALGKGNTRTVHSLVAEAFLGPYPAGCEVRHKDGDRQNPHKDNLEYGSRYDNVMDTIRHGRWPQEKLRRGHKRYWEIRRAVY